MLGLLKRLYWEEDGQGMTEYIVILIVIVAIAFVFRSRIRQALNTALAAVQNRMNWLRWL